MWARWGGSKRRAAAVLCGAIYAAAVGGDPAGLAQASSQRAPGGRDAGRDAAQPACRAGYRLMGKMRDFPLGWDWMVYADCLHPEKPRQAVALEAGALSPAPEPARYQEEKTGTEGETRPSPGAGESETEARAGASIAHKSASPKAVSAAAPATPAVAAGGAVRVWRRDGSVAIDLGGVALESGGTGSRIRVRIQPGGKTLRGTVRGAGSVELEAPGAGGFQGEGR
jgi:hypothetical protein